MDKIDYYNFKITVLSTIILRLIRRGVKLIAANKRFCAIGGRRTNFIFNVLQLLC